MNSRETTETCRCTRLQRQRGRSVRRREVDTRSGQRRIVDTASEHSIEASLPVLLRGTPSGSSEHDRAAPAFDVLLDRRCLIRTMQRDRQSSQVYDGEVVLR